MPRCLENLSGSLDGSIFANLDNLSNYLELLYKRLHYQLGCIYCIVSLIVKTVRLAV